MDDKLTGRIALKVPWKLKFCVLTYFNQFKCFNVASLKSIDVLELEGPKVVVAAAISSGFFLIQLFESQITPLIFSSIPDNTIVLLLTVMSVNLLKIFTETVKKWKSQENNLLEFSFRRKKF
jgi:hypothetical protein